MTDQNRTELSWIMPDGSVVGTAEAERHLADVMQKCERAFEGAVDQLAQFYARSSQRQRAVALIERLIRSADSPEQQAAGFLRMGLLMELLQDFSAAASAYTQALALEPASPRLWYWILNNLGFCLNQLGRHPEAEHYCRPAIETDPERHNAYKNLGVSLAGQGRFLEAAEAFVKATKLNPRDPRALGHLEDLLVARPEVYDQGPDLRNKLIECKNLVVRAQHSWTAANAKG